MFTKKSLRYLLVLILLSFSVFLFFGDDANFLANILSFEEIEIIEHNDREIAYKNENNQFDIYYQGSQEDEIILDVEYNPSLVDINIDNIEYQGKMDVLEDKKGYLKFLLKLPENFDKTQSSLLFNYTGNQNQIILTNAQLENKSRLLKIGNISSKNNVHKN